MDNFNSINQQLYKQLCIQARQEVNFNILEGIKNQNINLNLENLQENDVNIFSDFLQMVTFKYIKLHGNQ